jgi:glyoxylase-like metal-dependent hydrolase (beta-lactamase superfamily II)
VSPLFVARATLDITRRFPDDVALHKSGASLGNGPRKQGMPPGDGTRRAIDDAMTAPMPAVLDYPFPAPPAPGATIEVAPRIHWLRMPLPFALDHINLWLLADDDGFALVDCGYGDGPTRALWEQHFAAVLAARPLARIVATHCHPDHVGNAAWLSARTGAPVAMTHAEFLTAHALAGQHGGYGAAPTIALFRKHGMAPEHIAAFDARGNPYRRGVPELPATFDRLLDGDTRTLGGTAWTVVEGHGHSPEHASLFSRERGVLISGDMLLPKISTNVSVWAPEPDGDPLRRFLDSIAAFETLPPDTLVLPSHGLPFRGIPVRVAQLRAHHDARLSELAAAVAAAPAPVSAADVVPVLFRRELDLQQRYFAMGEAIAHLNRLWRAGRVVRDVAADGAIRFSPPRP